MHVSSYITQVFRQYFWMKKFGHMCPKRTLVLSNSPVIRLLDKGPLARHEMDGPVTVEQYISPKTGKVGYAGTSALKKTEILGKKLFIIFDGLLFRFIVSKYSPFSLPPASLHLGNTHQNMQRFWWRWFLRFGAFLVTKCQRLVNIVYLKTTWLFCQS